jgi:deoxycytidine triphosphate deaminase
LAKLEEPEEQLLVSRERGRRLAEAWASNPESLDIPNTLLTSNHIVSVVEKTGLISPFFYSRGRRKDRLKKAAYEGRIGSKAFIYKDKNSPQKIFDSSLDEYLVVPRNSIVFVECDLDFRIPDFVALRFNLQIQHVHRGLLLGTGPLIDPGFWGKLCIPLHNLTDEDYEIPRDEGLIWIEFTKTTLPSEAVDEARGPQESTTEPKKEHWDIEKFLHKAADQFRGHKVPIKSSLPTMFDAATQSAEKAAGDAKSAKDDAKSALDQADKIRNYNFFAMIAAAGALVTISVAFVVFLVNLSNRNEEIAVDLKNEAESARNAIQKHISDVERYGTTPDEARTSVPALKAVVERQQGDIQRLSDQVSELKAELDRIKPKPRDPNRPAG